MDTIKKLASIFFLGLISIFSLQAQDYKTMQDAFEKSYLYEYSGDYSKAIDGFRSIAFFKRLPSITNKRESSIVSTVETARGFSSGLKTSISPKY